MTDAHSHQFPIRVYFEDTDAGGIVYYANYLRYAERARTEMLRRVGVESSHLMAEEGVALTVRHCAVDYIKPAKLDDEIMVETRLLKVGGASLNARQIVRRGGEDLVIIELKLGCMNMQGGAARMPAAVRERLRGMTVSETNEAEPRKSAEGDQG